MHRDPESLSLGVCPSLDVPRIAHALAHRRIRTQPATYAQAATTRLRRYAGAYARYAPVTVAGAGLGLGAPASGAAGAPAPRPASTSTSTSSIDPPLGVPRRPTRPICAPHRSLPRMTPALHYAPCCMLHAPCTPRPSTHSRRTRKLDTPLWPPCIRQFAPDMRDTKPTHAAPLSTQPISLSLSRHLLWLPANISAQG